MTAVLAAGATRSRCRRRCGTPETGRRRRTTLRYYRSTDATITTSDTAAGTDAGRRDWPRRREQQPSRSDLTAPSTSANLVLRCVRGRGGWRVGHGEQLLGVRCGSRYRRCRPRRPRPRRRRPARTWWWSHQSVSDSSPGRRGDSFTLSATVRNAGDGASAAHDAAVLPVDGRDDRDVRHGGGHGRRSAGLAAGASSSRVGRI